MAQHPYYTRRTPAQRIQARLVSLGYGCPELPYRIIAGHHQRSQGAATWGCVIYIGGLRRDLFCWETMTACLRVPMTRWDVYDQGQFGSGISIDWALDLKDGK